MQWQAQKGAALRAETADRRAREAPRRDALNAEALAIQQRQVQTAVAEGRMGPREAEFIQISRSPELAPAARRDAVREWMASHGAELRAEIDTRRTALPVPPVRPASPVHPPAP